MEEEKKEIPSPFIDQPQEQFDYETLQDNTAVKAMVEIWKVFGEDAEKVAMKHTVTKEEWQENINVVSQKVMGVLIECNVAHRDMQSMLDNFYGMLQFVFKTISRQYNEYEKELLAYTIKAENPGNQLYDRDYATVSDLFKALQKARETEGDMGAKYFNIQKK